MFADQLRKSLLQAAITGKLTEQLPTDGDARDLLKKIRAKKAKLVAEKKTKAEKPLPPITDEEIPFDIPDNWCWVRLGDVCQLTLPMPKGRGFMRSLQKPYSHRQCQIAPTRSPEGLRLLFTLIPSFRVICKTLLYTRHDSLSPATKVAKCRAAVRVSVRGDPTPERLHCLQDTSRCLFNTIF